MEKKTGEDAMKLHHLDGTLKKAQQKLTDVIAERDQLKREVPLLEILREFF